MHITISDRLSGQYDAVIRFLQAGSPVHFSDPGLQQAYAAVFSGDELTLEHKQLEVS